MITIYLKKQHGSLYFFPSIHRLHSPRKEDVEIPNCVQLAILPPDASCEGRKWVTVDGINPAPVDRWFIHVYPIIYRVSTILLVVQDFATIHSMLGISYPAELGFAFHCKFVTVKYVGGFSLGHPGRLVVESGCLLGNPSSSKWRFSLRTW